MNRRILPTVLFLSLFLPNQLLQAQSCDGGTVTTAAGDTTTYTCPGDGNADAIDFSVTGNSSDNFTYVVTDDQGIILGLPPANTVDFEGAGTGTCYVWGLSYTGNLTAQVGDDATSVALSDSCFDLSDNFVRVFRDNPDGGRVYTVSGDTTDYTCPGDGIADEISFMVNGNSNSNFQWVVTNDQGVILGLPPGNTVNFEGAGVGNCLVWGLAYTGNLTASMGDNALQIALSDDCFDLSDNFVTVFRDNPDGGRVYTTSADTVAYTCPGDGIADEISFMVDGNSNSNFQWVVTDDQGTILGLPPGNTVNFEGAGVGNCLVWGLAYTGNLTASMGDNVLQIALSDDCFDLSDNFVTVFRDNPDGGRVYTTSADTVVYTCAGDGIADEISFMVNGNSNSNFQWVVTDDQGTILGLPPGNTVNFEGAGPGNCYVWGLAYTGNLTASMGDNAFQIAFSDDCYDLSDNFVEVRRNEDCVNGFTLIDARADSDIQPLNDGDVLILNQLPRQLNVRADVFGSGIGSVVFKLNGHRVRVENFAPYALAGDRNGDYFGLSNIHPGTYTLMATPYSRRGARGTAGSPMMVTFTIVRSMNRVTGFTLVDADTDQDIGPIADGDVIDPNVLGARRFSIRANTDPGVVGSLVFGINGRHRTENYAPYSLGGDRNGNYYPVRFQAGSNTISATPWEKRNSMGDRGMTESITITYIPSNRNRDFEAEASLNLYPNPGQGRLNLEISGIEAGKLQLEILNLQGARVYAEELSSSSNFLQHRLNLESLSDGSYFINLRVGEKILRQKYIKQ
ncbi:MAG: T9SS type A sorting domain-containing protein [Bacteroidota bacterium]